MNIAVIGGGINGLCIAWQLAEHGLDVDLYERKELLSETSSASTKLLHGGLRYLENGELSLVKEALYERAWWLENMPEYTNSIAICIPCYKSMARPLWKVKIGLWLYDRLAGKKNIANHKFFNTKELLQEFPDLKTNGLNGAYVYYDGQMDELGIAKEIKNKLTLLGVSIHTNVEIDELDTKGNIQINNSVKRFDFIVNATGPWVDTLLAKSNLSSDYALELVKGSHIVLNGKLNKGLFIEHAIDKRPIFILPYKGKILVGTTEVNQVIDQDIACSYEEKEYLLQAYNQVFNEYKTISDIEDDFSGVRPLIKSNKGLNKASREYALEVNDKLINVWGGKWTTARSLARKVISLIQTNHKANHYIPV